MTTSILIIYLLILVSIALVSYRKVKTHSDFFVATKKGSYWAVTGSLIATILGGSAVIGAIDAGKSMGWATSWYMLCASIGLLAMLPLSKKINKIGRFSLPDLLEDLYGRDSKNISSLIIPVAWLGIIAAQIIASAKILQSFTGMNYETGVLISGIVFSAYTIAGGQISILKTDFLQAILIILGLLFLFFFTLLSEKPLLLQNQVLKFPFNPAFKPIDLLILIITYSTTFTAGPDIYSRLFCAKNEKTAKNAVLTTALILIPIAFLIGYLGVYGSNITEGVNGSVLVNISQLVLPVWCVPLIVIALLSAVLSSADTTILSSSIILTDIFERSNFGKKTLQKSRFIILIIGLISIIISLKFTSIIGMLLIALTVYSGAFIVPVILGLSGFKSKGKFVSAAIILGGSLALIGKLLAYNGNAEIGNSIIIAAFVINALIMLLGKK